MQRNICIMFFNKFGKPRAEVTGWRKFFINIYIYELIQSISVGNDAVHIVCEKRA